MLALPQKIEVKGVFEIPEICRDRINALWKGGEESEVVSVVHYSPEAIAGQLVPYRVVYACLKDQELSSILDIQPLCVSGKVIWNEKILVGRRSIDLSTFPGHWELCPSGIVDKSAILSGGRVDFGKALLKELEEETGISSVQTIRPIGLYFSPGEKTWDICLELTLTGDFTLRPTKEYDRLEWMDPHETKEGPWVPLSKILV